MGTLVFQATLGGSVNLIGPNTASTINFTLPSADGTSGQALVTNGSGTLSFSSVTTAPAGSNTQVQFNNSGVFGASSSFTWDGAQITVNGITVGRGAGAVSTNTAVGASALASGSLSGGNNTGVGYLALQSNTTAANVTAIGRAALNSNTTGDANTGLGGNSLLNNSTGAYNTAVGQGSLQGNTTASNNTAVGYQAGYSNVTGTSIVAVGQGALYNNTASNNTALGKSSLNANTTGTDNSSGGKDSLGSNTTGSYNTAFGSNALVSNTTASYNTAVGYQAGYTNTTGTGGVFIGRGAGYASNASYSTYLGDTAGYSTTGAQNTFVGNGAGYNVTSGSKHTILGLYQGNSGGLDIRTASNYIVLSDGDGNPRLICNGSGEWSMGENPITGYKLNIKSADSTASTFATMMRNSSSTNLLLVRSDGYFSTGTAANSPYNSTTGSAANVYVDSGGQLSRSTSSLKYKTDVQDATHGLAEVLALRPVTYKGKRDGDTIFGGLIAEEVHAAGLTEFVQYADDGSPDALAYGNMVSLCIKAIQELKAEIDTLKGNV